MPTAEADPVATPALLADWRKRADVALVHALDGLEGTEPRLLAAMRHAVLLGGKRMRPLLVYASGSACLADEDALDAPAAAVELVHAYSLVHDDLPAMDDDALRRGQPTVHVAFDEATGDPRGRRCRRSRSPPSPHRRCRPTAWSRCWPNSPMPPAPAACAADSVRPRRHRQGIDDIASRTRTTARTQDRRPASRVGALRAPSRPAPTRRRAHASTISPTPSGSASRSATTCSTSKATAPRWARPPARTWRRTRPRFPRSSASRPRASAADLPTEMRDARVLPRRHLRAGGAGPLGDRARRLSVAPVATFPLNPAGAASTDSGIPRRSTP